MYIAPYLFVFFTCVSCSPILTRFFSSIGCTKSISQRLDPIQAQNPNLSLTNSFGYINSMRNSIMEFDSDIQIHSTSNPEAEWLPSNATASLSHISFNEPASKLILKGRFSASNFDKLVLSVRNATMIDLSFSMYAFDAFHQTWYNRLESTTGISGKIERMETIQKFGKDKDSFQEVMMEISPSLSNDKRYIKYMTSSDKESLREIKWSPTLKNECKPGLVVNRSRRYLNELFESAILL